MISANEQELMDELKERLMQFMKEEEQAQLIREAKGLFANYDGSTADSSQRDKKYAAATPGPPSSDRTK